MNRLLAFALFLLSLPLFAQPALNGRTNQELQQLTEGNQVFASATLGFALYDLASQTYLYGHNAQKYFVPASNVKLLTFYLSQRVLGYRTPAIYYQEYADHYELWGAGYPLLLHPSFFGYDELFPWLTALNKPLVFHFPSSVPRYGAGWSWDDYPYGYVYERSALPVYGNRLHLMLSPPDANQQQSVVGYPAQIAGAMVYDGASEERLSRPEYANEFTSGPDLYQNKLFPVERSLSISTDGTMRSLATALPGRSLKTSDRALPTDNTLAFLEVSLPDTVYRKVLTHSDNFLAEQLLLQSAMKHSGSFDEDAILTYGTDTLLADLGLFEWRDASGLSRYNLVQPDQFARLMIKLDTEVGRERLMDLLATGGESGTLKRRFTDKEAPYVWAKTGSLSGVMAISGLVQTKSGRWLTFSFLLNNYVGRTSEAYVEIERLVGYVRDNL